MRTKIIEVISNELFNETDTIMDPFEDHVYIKFQKELGTSAQNDDYSDFIKRVSTKIMDAIEPIVNTEAKDFAGWIANQNIQGRTYHKLWMDYCEEKRRGKGDVIAGHQGH